MAEPNALRVPLQSRSQRTRAALVAAARAEFAGRGYAPTTAKSVAERAGVGTGTFYHYFPDKDAVLRELAKERVQHLLDRTEPLSGPVPASSDLPALADNARTRMRQLVQLYVEYHRVDKGLHAVITERRLCDPQLDAIMAGSEREAVTRLTRSLREWGYEGDAEAAAFMAFSLLEGAVHGHVLTQAMVSETRFVNGLVEAMLRISAPSRLLSGAVAPDRKEHP